MNDKYYIMTINDSINEKEINELKKELKKHQKEYKLYQRIQAVLMVKLEKVGNKLLNRLVCMEILWAHG